VLGLGVLLVASGVALIAVLALAPRTDVKVARADLKTACQVLLVSGMAFAAVGALLDVLSPGP
jgi:hypothetical protein